MSTVYLHHALLHFPIGLLIVGGILAAIALWKRSEVLDKLLMVLMAIGLLFSLAAVTTGLLIADHVIKEGAATLEAVQSHRNAAVLSGILALIGLVLLWWIRNKSDDKIPGFLGRIFVIAGAVVVIIAGHRGGQMMHPSITPFASEHTHYYDEGAASQESEDEHHSHEYGSERSTDKHMDSESEGQSQDEEEHSNHERHSQ